MTKTGKKLRNSKGQYLETWMLDEGTSHRWLTDRPMLPAVNPRWKALWVRKRGKRYYAAEWRGAVAGKRVRVQAKSGPELLEKIRTAEREILQHGALARALTTEQRFIAARCFTICGRLGVSLLDVVIEFERTHPHGANARTLDQVRVEVVASKRKKGCSDRHILSLDYRLRTLVKALGNKPITAITTKELQHELDAHASDWNPTTIHGVTQGWKIAFNFAIRQGYLLKNPANLLELPRVVHPEPSIFSVRQVRQLMAATLFRDRHPLLPHCRAYLAIGMFAGLRPEEIEKLEWKHVDLASATIRVKAANAKDRDRRIVEIQPNLSAWLAPVVRRAGHVLAHSLAELRVAARGVFGLKEWPHDIMRHTFVSYHFGEFQNEAYTKKQVGHRDDGRIFYDHYMVPVSKADARQFWATIPPVALLTP